MSKFKGEVIRGMISLCLRRYCVFQRPDWPPGWLSLTVLLRGYAVLCPDSQITSDFSMTHTLHWGSCVCLALNKQAPVDLRPIHGALNKVRESVISSQLLLLLWPRWCYSRLTSWGTLIMNLCERWCNCLQDESFWHRRQNSRLHTGNSSVFLWKLFVCGTDSLVYFLENVHLFQLMCLAL